MRRFWYRHRSLIGYLTIVLVAVIAVEVHHRQTTGEIRRNNLHVCRNAEVVSNNQRVVLNYLIWFSASHGDHSAQLHRALQKVPIEFCEGIGEP